MSKEEKENVDVKGLSTFMCYSLVGMGTVPLLTYYACLGVGHADWASYCILLPILYIPYLINQGKINLIIILPRKVRSMWLLLVCLLLR